MFWKLRGDIRQKILNPNFTVNITTKDSDMNFVRTIFSYEVTGF